MKNEVLRLTKNRVNKRQKYKKVVFSDELKKWEDFLPYLKALNIFNKRYKITIEETT